MDARRAENRTNHRQESLQRKQRTRTNVIMNKKGGVLFYAKEVGERWRECIGELFNSKGISGDKHFL